MTDYAWCITLVPFGYLLYLLTVNVLAPYFMNDGKPVEVVETEAERKKREKRERQEARAAKFAGRR